MATKRSDKYILDKDNNIIPATLMEWAAFFEYKTKRIVKQETIGKHFFSTVFLGLDHNFSDDPKAEPLIFETMIFSPGTNEKVYTDRYSTWAQAEKGHAKAIKWFHQNQSKVSKNAKIKGE